MALGAALRQMNNREKMLAAQNASCCLKSQGIFYHVRVKGCSYYIFPKEDSISSSRHLIGVFSDHKAVQAPFDKVHTHTRLALRFDIIKEHVLDNFHANGKHIALADIIFCLCETETRLMFIHPGGRTVELIC